MNERKNRSKVTRYAIKKLSMGTASVAVALGFMLVQGQTIAHAGHRRSKYQKQQRNLQKRRKMVEDDKAAGEAAAENQKQQLQLRV